MTNSADTAPSRWRLPLALFLVAGLTAAVCWPVVYNDFISYDDTDYVTLNMMVRQGITFKGFLWAFSAFHAGNWHPLTWLSHMLDVELFALKPMGHHATNLLIHTVNSVLLCALLHRVTGYLGKSVVVALLFAVHPLHVESVAWVAERKDVLSTLFWFLTMWAYSEYATKPSLKRYFPVAVFFALGLLAKQMLVTLPLILLLMDYWPLNRFPAGNIMDKENRTIIKRLLMEKVPFIIMSAAATLLTLGAQESARAITHGDGQSVLLNAGNACISYIKYILKMMWPTDLALFYPFETSAVTVVTVAGAIVLLLVLSGIVVTQGKSRPYLAFGWFWYLITLLPVIGFIRIGGHSLADRYTYIPMTGLFLILVWGCAETIGKLRKGLPVMACVAVFVLSILSVLTVKQIGYWENSYTLYSHALAVVERNWMAHNNIGILLAQQNRIGEAMNHFQESVRINPKGIEGFRNLGNVYQMAGNNNAAIVAFNEAVRIKPDDAESHYRLGYAYLLSGNSGLAFREYEKLQHLDELRAKALFESIKILGNR